MYYFKEAIFIFFYELIMSTIALAIMAIESVWLKLSLSILCVAFYLFIVVVYFLQNGQKALKKRHQNDLQRKRMIETGEFIDIKSIDEYKVWKGFLIGAFAFVPMILLLTIYGIVLLCGGTGSIFNGINNIVYILFSAPIMTFVDAFQGAISFTILYGAVLTSITSGVGYMLGAKKIQNQYDAIAKKQKYLHGEE